jgi:hypothetical protein
MSEFYDPFNLALRKSEKGLFGTYKATYTITVFGESFKGVFDTYQYEPVKLCLTFIKYSSITQMSGWSKIIYDSFKKILRPDYVTLHQIHDYLFYGALMEDIRDTLIYLIRNREVIVEHERRDAVYDLILTLLKEYTGGYGYGFRSNVWCCRGNYLLYPGKIYAPIRELIEKDRQIQNEHRINQSIVPIIPVGVVDRSVESLLLPPVVEPTNEPTVEPTAPDLPLLTCSICFDCTVDTRLDPCGHMYCRKCTLHSAQCPRCRQYISTRQKVYFCAPYIMYSIFTSCKI